MIMNKKTLKKLEYNKITELLAEQASSPGGKILCSHLAPMTSLAVLALYLLPFSFGRVEVGLSGFIGNFHGGASFGSSS